MKPLLINSTNQYQRIPYLYFEVFFALILFGSCTDSEESVDTTEVQIVEVPVTDKLPQVYVNTNGQEIPDEPKIFAEISIENKGTLTHEGFIGIEIRGQSSQMFPKKQYGFETRDSENEDIDVSLLGLPEEEDWILHAPYSDKSLIRNVLIYDISRDIGRYSSRLVFVELFLNNIYDGLYILMEKLKRDKNRIDINKLKSSENEGEDLTGGYIIKIDKEDSYDQLNSFTSSIPPPNSTSNQQIRFVFDTPDEVDITDEQRNYIKSYIYTFEAALNSDDFTDTENGYSKYIDVASFVDFFILNELSNNVDGYRLSTWLVKDKNELLSIGPIWDFNLAFGNANYCDGGRYDVWAYKFNERCPNDFWQVPFWWDRFMEDPNFKSLLQQRWNALRNNELSENSILSKIDTYVSLFESSGSGKANFSRWQVLGEYVWPNEFIGGSYPEEINYLKDWIFNRLVWMDSEINTF
tara:strand:- start:7101 stop:8498 length:1398 start_codon:yes stop_codon:yes gene_type:complete